VVYRLSKVIVRSILRIAFGFRVEGAEYEPATGPVVVVSNHVSDLDPLVVGASLRRRVGFMAKHELFRHPLLRWWITACGAFPVRRGEPDRQALRAAHAVLSRGGVLVMFPEGTRGRGRALRPPEPGAAVLALRTGAAILPVAVLGTGEVLPRDARRLRRARVRVRIAPPIRVAARAGQSAEGSEDAARDGTRIVGDAAGAPARHDRDAVEALGRRYMAEIARLLASVEVPPA
jgi:1-acyl-sn-glycerol-3-phosphate acyltransferase